jgi:molybdenum cofactor cytidylyltransferase
VRLETALRISSGDVVAFVGGGGKTTAMFQLARELAAGQRVLTTTTTRIFAAQIQRSPAHVTFESGHQSIDDILPVLNAAIDRHGQVLLIGHADPVSGKAFGIEPEIIDQLAETGQFDAVLIEADGSRMRPFKAPAGHEPVIPVSTSVVVPVIGLDILDQPLTDDTVHRAQRVSELSGTPLDAPVTVETLIAVLCHPQGGLKNVPPDARILPLLNKAETEALRNVAERIAGSGLGCQRIEAMLVGAVKETNHPVHCVYGRSAAIILAAGGSTRFGSPKQLARWHNSTFIERVVDTALKARVNPVVVVLGAAAGQCRQLLEGRPVTIVENPDWSAGQSTSLKAGLNQLPAGISGVVFLLVDQPAIPSDVIDKLVQRHQETLAPVVWPEYKGRRGNPVLFDRALFPELSVLRGDIGGRPLLQRYAHNAERVAVNSPAILNDIDHPEDFPPAETGREGTLT